MGSLSNNKQVVDFLNQDDLVRQLKAIGLHQGDVVEVHASLKNVGYILGGAMTLLDALLDVVGLEGTLVMSAHTWGNSEPAYFQNPPIEVESFERLRTTHPPFRGKVDDFRMMGDLVRAMQLKPNAYVSDHPQYAFIAIGKHAKWITQNHPLGDGFGLSSPMGRLLELKSKILLIGVGYDRATGMHLGESLSQIRPIQIQGSRILVRGEAQWVKFLTQDFDSDDFVAVGAKLEQMKLVEMGILGQATCRLFPLVEATALTRKIFEERL